MNANYTSRKIYNGSQVKGSLPQNKHKCNGVKQESVLMGVIERFMKVIELTPNQTHRVSTRCV